MTHKEFTKLVYSYYKKHGRHDLPWRAPSLKPRKNGSLDPYKIMVSEVMLQQTQVERVIPKYKAFIKKFPNARTLAKASLGKVLKEWSGLGYNRRARFLKQASESILKEYDGTFPQEKSELINLPGIGNYTAGAIRAFAFNKADIFLETNIRSAYIHHFFPKRKLVDDKELLSLVEKTLDITHPRKWYSALMDYGTHLKSSTKNPTRRSASYKRQSTFIGSIRQIRGKVLKYMLKNGSLPVEKVSFIEENPERAGLALAGLIKDRLIKEVGKSYRLVS